MTLSWDMNKAWRSGEELDVLLDVVWDAWMTDRQ